MRELTANDRRVCTLQGKAFEASRTLPCGSGVFVRRFMNSQTAHRLDKGGLLGETLTPEELCRLVEAEYGPTRYGSEQYSPEELYWMGYLYRYWAILTETPSSGVYKILGATKLRQLYYPYHSLDPQQAVERILESEGIRPALSEAELLERGAAILRRLEAQRR